MATRGVRVECVVCGKSKRPHGRSVPMEMERSLCSPECDGYNLDPQAGCLWPGETDDEFGYRSCKNATEETE